MNLSVQKLEEYEALLNEQEWISSDQQKLTAYIQAIHNLPPRDKAYDLGRAMFVCQAIEGAQLDADTFSLGNEISAEVNDRMYAHLLYLM